MIRQSACAFPPTFWRRKPKLGADASTCGIELLLLGAIVMLAGCGGSPGGNLQSYDPPTAAAKAVQLYDRNGDGQLSAEELKASPALIASARRLDANRDGNLTVEEIEARLEELQKWPKFIGLDVSVTARGRPLVGAQLKLTPEAFMGDNYPTLSGSTVEGRGGVLTAEGPDLPGIPTGFYTLRIVDPSQNINAVRGIEIAEDTTGSRLEINL